MARFHLPTKFLCRWPLRIGALCAGILMLITMLGVTVATLVQAIYMSKTEKSYYSRNAYAYSITANLFAGIMMLLHGLFIWAVWKNRKPSLLLSWAVLTAVWLVLSLALFVVLIFLYAQSATFVTWIICLALGLVGFCILFYGLAIGFAFFLERHDAAAAGVAAPQG